MGPVYHSGRASVIFQDKRAMYQGKIGWVSVIWSRGFREIELPRVMLQKHYARTIEPGRHYLDK